MSLLVSLWTTGPTNITVGKAIQKAHTIIQNFGWIIEKNL